MDAYQRRKILLQKMATLSQEHINCHNCTGLCCTFAMNSMQITALEAQDIFLYLKEQGLLTDQMRQHLQSNVQRFQLDRPMPGSGKRNYLRRTYTCPFFVEGPRGCSLPAEIKPYGCLGFNPLIKMAQGEHSCHSDQVLLVQREAQHAEEAAVNAKLKEQHQFSWDKESIPMALLHLWDKMGHAQRT